MKDGGGSETPASRRHFAAILLPSGTRSFLAAAGLALQDDISVRLRLVREEQLHVTLRFYGRLASPSAVDRLASALRARAPDRLPWLSFAGFSAFPSPRRARIAFARFREAGPGADPNPTDRLAAWRAAAEAAARDVGLPAERRRFVPHATIARFGSPTPLPDRFVAEPPRLPAVPTASDPFPASEVALVASVLTPDGPSYDRVARFGDGA